jgi:hypothetical protein
MARIADVRGRIRAWVALHVRPFERRWIPDAAERERHEAVVIRRLEQRSAEASPANV